VQRGEEKRRRRASTSRFHENARVREFWQLGAQVGSVRAFGDDQDAIWIDQWQQTIDGVLDQRPLTVEL